MKEKIEKKNLRKEYYSAEKCFITEISNTLDDPDVSIARVRVEPGVTTRWHRLRGIFERYWVLSGMGVVEIGEQSPQEVTAGDIIFITPMCRQRITNTGDDDLIFLAICSPRFTQEAYEDIENIDG